MPDTSSARSSQSLWTNRNFLLLSGGQFVSWIGTEVSGIAIPLVVLAMTHSPAQAGLIAGIRGLVYVVWAIPAGVLIDRWDRRRVMVIANLGSGIAMSSIFIALLLGHLTITQLYLAGSVEGSFFVFANLSRFAAIPRVVSREQISAAAAQTSVSSYIALLLGPALGGFIYQSLGAVSSFFLDALSYFINSLSIFFITVPLQVERTKHHVPLKHELRVGITWLWQHPSVRFINILMAGGTIAVTGLNLLVIILARQHHASSTDIGIIFATGAIGGVAGSFCASWINKRVRFHRILLLTTTMSFLVFTCFAIASNMMMLALITAAFNVMTAIYEVVAFSYTASIIPDEVRGRVSSLTRLVTLGAYSLGFSVMGFLLQWVGTTVSILIFSCLLLSLTLLTLFNRSLRQVTS